MNIHMWIELFGYTGSILIVVSMLMSSVTRLRTINLIGCIISATYAFIIGTYPLVFMNVCLVLINAYNLFRLSREELS